MSKTRNLSAKCLDDMAKHAAWKERDQCLSNYFVWDPDSRKDVHPMEGRAPHTPLQLVIKTIKLMKCGKGAGYIPNQNWNSASLWSWRGSADSWSNRGYYPLWEEWILGLNGRRVLSSPSTRASRVSPLSKEIIEASNCYTWSWTF